MTSLIEAVLDATADMQHVYKLGSVPAKPIPPYVVFSAQLVEDGTFTLDGSGSVRWVQIVAQTFGRTIDSVSAHSEAFRSALIDEWLTWDGYSAGPIAGELRPTPPTRDPDDGGVLGSTATYTATATKE